MSPTMNRRSSLGPITRLRSGSGPLTSWFAEVVADMVPPRSGSWSHRRPIRAWRPERRPRRERANSSAEEDLGLGVLLGPDQRQLAGAFGELNVVKPEQYAEAEVFFG